MKDSLKIATKAVSVILVVVYIVFVIFVVKVISYQALTKLYSNIIIAACILIPPLAAYFLWRARRASSEESRNKDVAILNDLVNIRKGDVKSVKSSYGYYYLAAMIIAIIFPFIINFVNMFISDSETQSSVTLIAGYTIIIVFIIGVVQSAKNKE